MLRQIVLDTETTGLSPKDGHRIIEIGCLEMVNRRLTGNHFHQYINPEREIDREAEKVHGITQKFLEDKPVFSAIAEEFMDFVRGADLIIHNAPFDIGFINHELKLLDKKNKPVTASCEVIDTLVMAKQMYPGQKNNLDALCRRFSVDNTNRDLHGALLDSELLAQVYLLMTGGQTQLFDAEQVTTSEETVTGAVQRLSKNRKPLRVIKASPEELAAHEAFLEGI